MSILAILLAASAASAPEPSRANLDCRSARIELVRTLKPVVNPEATLSTPEDDDPDTVQFLVIDGLRASEGSVSPNGQVIYLPRASLDGPEADESIGVRLFARAIDILLAQQVGNRCDPLEVGPART